MPVSLLSRGFDKFGVAAIVTIFYLERGRNRKQVSGAAGRPERAAPHTAEAYFLGGGLQHQAKTRALV
jgi:hypothetical protein